MPIKKREPKQDRAINKKEKIILASFNLFSQKGYYNTNTSEIAKEAGVSIGIVYQYFDDKFEIFMESLKKYGDDIFFPLLKYNLDDIDIIDFEKMIKKMINFEINNHSVSEIAHEEIITMVHSNKEVANYFYEKEVLLTNKIEKALIKNNFDKNKLREKIQIMLGLIDNLCHEIIYHKCEDIDYDYMTDEILNLITIMFDKN